jgi:hypothetical protein
MNYDDQAWWLQPTERAGNAVAITAKYLWDKDVDRRIELERNVRRFGWRPLRGLGQASTYQTDRDNVRLNITKAAIETITAKVGKNRPRPTVLTYGGNYALRTRAKKLQQFLDGSFYQSDAYSTMPPVFRDAMLCGTGFWHFYADAGRKKCCVERVFPAQMLVDPADAVNGDPSMLYRIHFLDRERLVEQYPELEDKLRSAVLVPINELPDFLPLDPDSPVAGRMIMVTEGWRRADVRPDGSAVPGRYVRGAAGITLCDEPWEHDFFPFERMHWSSPVTGYFGDSAAGEIRGIEKEVNRLLQNVQKAMDLCGKPIMMIPIGSKVNKAKATNETALIMEYDGPTAPSIQTFQPVHPQVLQQAWTLYAKAFEILGTNELQSAAVKPPGIESGRALEQLSEEHQVRFATVIQAFEDVVARGFSRQFLRMARELDAELKERGEAGYELRAVANKTALKIKWADACMSPDDFFVQCWPTSVLPHTPSGRTAEVERWQQNGWASPDESKKLLDFPDLDAASSILTADQDLLDQQLEDMLDNGKDIMPDKRQDLEKALTWGTFTYERAKTDGADMAALDRVNNFLLAVEAMIPPPPVQTGVPTPTPGAAAPSGGNGTILNPGQMIQ